MEWQRIESAPYTGATRDILVSDGRRVAMAWFSSIEGVWCDSTVGDPHDPTLDPQPTHWMPLPEPPHD
jgi:hypothetical protein